MVNELFAVAFEQPGGDGPEGEDDSGMIHWAVFDDAGERYAVPSGKPAGWPEPSKKLLRIVYLRREP